jgi:hypothetical protein
MKPPSKVLYNIRVERLDIEALKETAWRRRTTAAALIRQAIKRILKAAAKVAA